MACYVINHQYQKYYLVTKRFPLLLPVTWCKWFLCAVILYLQPTGRHSEDLKKSSCLSSAVELYAHRSLCTFGLVKAVILYFGVFLFCSVLFGGTCFNTNTEQLLFSLNSDAQCYDSAAATCLWMSLDAVWSKKAQSAPADGGVGHKFTQTRSQWNSMENTDITTVGTSCIFQYSCLCVSQVFSGSRVSNWLLNNKLAAVNQPITNKCHLVFSCTLLVLLFWGLSLSFCSFEIARIQQ